MKRYFYALKTKWLIVKMIAKFCVILPKYMKFIWIVCCEDIHKSIMYNLRVFIKYYLKTIIVGALLLPS